MKLALMVAVGGLIVATCACPSVAANLHMPEIAGSESGGVQERTEGSITVAWTQKFVRVGPGSSTDRWKCSVAINGTVYFSTGFIESSARARLATRIKRPPFCRRKDREFFGFGFSF